MNQLSVRTIKRTRKVHCCNACQFLFLNHDIRSLFYEFNFEEKEIKVIQKAWDNGLCIQKGESCEYVAGISNDGDFIYYYHIPEIDDICIKYGFYDF